MCVLKQYALVLFIVFPCNLFVEETGIVCRVSYRFKEIQIWCFCQNFIGGGVFVR